MVARVDFDDVVEDKKLGLDCLADGHLIEVIPK